MLTSLHTSPRDLRAALAGVAIAASVLFTYAAGSRAETPAIAPGVETHTSTLHGLTGLSVNGRVHARGRPATYHFEYGPTPAYGSQTPTKPVPPRIGAYYRETWDQGWNGWKSWDMKHRHFPVGGASAGYIRYDSISQDDHNHDDGVGTVHLAQYMYLGRYNVIPSAYLAAGDPDLRDASVKIAVRGVDWKPNGTELMWWSQSQSNIEINPNDVTLAPGYKHPNWCYTGHSLTDLLLTGKWERAEYRLLNDTRLWSYCGNNGGSARYDAYWPIDDTQRHLNLDFFHMVVFVDPANRPTGSIDFDEFELAYRNYSLAAPANGGKLLASPQGSDDDPATLTDGWRHGPQHAWNSPKNPAGPLEFIYEFTQPVTIESIQIHQHPDWPSREVEVFVSADGTAWQPLAKGTIPEKVTSGPNFAFILQRGLKGIARQAKVRILSGYKPDHWGLGEIELFGTGAAYTTDDDWFHVNTDIDGLKPGETCHYRLVATSAAGTTLGENQQFTLPLTAQPHVLTGPASRLQSGTAHLAGRLNPLGLRTEFFFEYGPTEQYGQRTKLRYGGLQITPRLVAATLPDLMPGTVYHYRLGATNAAGTAYGADAVFTAR